VRLPVLDASRLATPGREQPAAAVAPSSTRPLRILLVEDHGDTADMTRLLLTMHGHDVKVAGDCACAGNVARSTASGQWRAMRDGDDGILGNHGNVVRVTYRF